VSLPRQQPHAPHLASSSDNIIPPQCSGVSANTAVSEVTVAALQCLCQENQHTHHILFPLPTNTANPIPDSCTDTNATCFTALDCLCQGDRMHHIWLLLLAASSLCSAANSLCQHNSPRDCSCQSNQHTHSILFPLPTNTANIIPFSAATQMQHMLHCTGWSVSSKAKTTCTTCSFLFCQHHLSTVQ